MTPETLTLIRKIRSITSSVEFDAFREELKRNKTQINSDIYTAMDRQVDLIAAREGRR